MIAPYIIAEIGNNHNGSLDTALSLVRASASAGANAVKFQSFRGTDIVSPRVKTSDYPEWGLVKYPYWHQFLDSIALKFDDHQTVIDEANQLGLDFITTPTSFDVVDLLEKMEGIRSYKIASMDLTNIPLLERIAATDKAVILSTGMGDINEIRNAVAILQRPELIILHCVSDYPLDPNFASLSNIGVLIEEFPNIKIGFSDHSLGHELSLAARCLGALVFEKHITLDENDQNPAEHHFSLNPAQFQELVYWLKCIDKNLNNKGFTRSPNEISNKSVYRRSYHYKKALTKGQRIDINSLIFVRPADGLSHHDISKLLDKKINRDVEPYEPCSLHDVD